MRLFICAVLSQAGKGLIVNFPFLDGDVPRSTSYGAYISQLIPVARASSYVADFNTRKTLLTQKFLNKSIGIINFANLF